MKKYIAAFKLFNKIRNNSALFEAIGGINELLERTHKEQRPMYQEIALINMGDGTKLGDFIKLWAGIGEANPIDRAISLKTQNNELMRLLKLVDEDKLNKVWKLQ
jgi:hypothetical protein